MQENYAVYVHIPFCKARCGYCAFSSCTDFTLQQKYFDVLSDEIDKAQADCVVKTMFWGGGTPSAVDIEYLRALFNKLNQKFDLSQMVEFTVECNPESTTEELLEFFRQIGVNRISFGLQSANSETLKKIGRLHTYEKFLSALNMARMHGFFNINADLILGLPESKSAFFHTVNTIVQLPLTHLSLYALEIHPENKHFKALCDSYNYTDDDLADMYDFAVKRFSEAGFARYEISNFAKNGFCCKHNLAYWKEQRYFGFGAAASGFVKDKRYTNIYGIKDYIDGSGTACQYEEQISVSDEMCEFVMLGLRLTDGINIAEFSKRFSTDFYQSFPACQKLIESGFLRSKDGRIFVPSDKFYVINSILVELLPNL